MNDKAKEIFQKTFGGLTTEYYMRQFLFGCIFLAIIVINVFNGAKFSLLLFGIVSTALYPYARFVYESIVNYIIGDNLFILNAFVMMAYKIFMMLMCWMFAIFIAPIGLLYLYIRHSKN